MNFKNLCSLILVIGLILAFEMNTNSMNFKTVNLKITGKVSQLNKQAEKWTGYAEFEGTAKDGTKYSGRGNVEITFTDKTQTVIKQISGQLKGKAGGQDFYGLWQTTQSIKISDKESIVYIRFDGVDGEAKN